MSQITALLYHCSEQIRIRRISIVAASQKGYLSNPRTWILYSSPSVRTSPQRSLSKSLPALYSSTRNPQTGKQLRVASLSGKSYHTCYHVYQEFWFTKSVSNARTTYRSTLREPKEKSLSCSRSSHDPLMILWPGFPDLISSPASNAELRTALFPATKLCTRKYYIYRRLDKADKIKAV